MSHTPSRTVRSAASSSVRFDRLSTRSSGQARRVDATPSRSAAACSCRKAASATTTLAVALDRAEGSTSLHDGELELLVHRRLLADDGLVWRRP
jgi:hypothetical protein